MSANLFKKSEVQELRQDLLTGNWVVVATTRAKRPHDFAPKRTIVPLPKVQEGCPFCEKETSDQLPDVLRLPDDPDKWHVRLFGNKYPAFTPKEDFKNWKTGPYRATEAVGYHEVLATRGHDQIDGLISREEFVWQIEAMVLRFRQLRSKDFVNYIQIIKNYGEEAGQSLLHPHQQIFTVPVLPSDVKRMLDGAEAYARKHNHDAFSAMIDFEMEVGDRIVWFNDDFVAYCPYASRAVFEVWIVPRVHNPFFENISPKERESLAEIMQQVLRRLYIGLNDPPFNYYIHSAPCDRNGFVCNQDQFQHFRWHIQILPRLAQWGGFELGTGLEITTAWPEQSAAFLREQKPGIA